MPRERPIERATWYTVSEGKFAPGKRVYGLLCGPEVNHTCTSHTHVALSQHIS
jgi:hypothetical protein